MILNIIQKFEERYMPVTETGCWLWIGVLDRGGYGRIPIKKYKVRSAHRVAWELFNGLIPNGLFVLHKCDTRSCVNPEHLFLGTQTDNMVDCAKKGRNANQRKMYCVNGHKFTPENTIIYSGKRKCKTCNKIRALAFYHKVKGTVK